MKRRVVVISATEFEIEGCRAVLPDCDFVVSGMGATNAAIATLRAIDRYKPDLIIQVGIAGAIDGCLKIGDAVFVTEDFQADLGAWRTESNTFVPFVAQKIMVENKTDLLSVQARSVNTACTNLICESDAQIESMEGAAFFQAASQFQGLDFMQIRTISNFVGSPRSEWNIPGAIEIIPEVLIGLLENMPIKVLETHII